MGYLANPPVRVKSESDEDFTWCFGDNPKKFGVRNNLGIDLDIVISIAPAVCIILPKDELTVEQQMAWAVLRGDKVAALALADKLTNKE